MAVEPFGPWLTPGEQPPPDASDEPDDGTWQVGTALDEFTPIYLALARWTDNHIGFSPAQVDEMDIAIVALLYGVRMPDQWETEQAAIVAARLAGRRVSWGDVSD